MTRPDPARRSRSGRAAGLVVGTLVALVALLAAACSSADAPGGGRGTPTEPSTVAAEAALPTRSQFGVVVGGMPVADRQRLRERITALVDDWIDAGFTGGEYPRSDFGAAFADFTPDARRLAADDAALLTNAGVGEQLDAVRATQRLLRLDVLAVRGRAVAVTARVQLELELEEAEASTVDRVAASLQLTHQAGEGWQVFAYDVTRGPA